MKKLALLVSFIIFLFTYESVSASCGTIVALVNNYQENSPTETHDIIDCDNPFQISAVGLPEPFIVGEIEVLPDMVLPIPIDGVRVYYKVLNQSSYDVNLYLHTPEGFEEKTLRYITPNIDEITKYVDTFTAQDKTYYDELLYLLSRYYYLTPDTPEFIWEDYPDELWDNYVYPLIEYTDSVHGFNEPLYAGIYTVVSTYGDVRYGVTFTLVTEVEEELELGMSSILFLPGIQASRLYLATDSENLAAGERLWEPDNNDEVRALRMNEQGESVNEVYSDDVIDTVTTNLLFGYEHKSGDVYRNISTFFDELVDEGSIHEWRPYAYDWRHDVFSVVADGTQRSDGTLENVLTVLDQMSTQSQSGKVTIVAHSNGGLLAKAIMLALEAQNKDSLIDHIIFIGTPHFGTPKAIATLLHGYDQQHGGGLVVKGSVAREIIQNLPGAYGLLPSAAYLQTESDPLITFDDSNSTAVYRDNYGTSISDYQNLQEFLSGNNESFRTIDQSLYIPAPTNTGLLEQTTNQHQTKLDNWTPKNNLRISSIIGVGLPTIRGISYRDVTQAICEDTAVTFVICAVASDPRPFAELSYYGDGTVMMRGAELPFGDVYNLDLISLNKEKILTNKPRIDHANMTETSYVHSLIDRLLLATTTEGISYVTTSPLIEVPGGYTIQKIASPVQMSSTDALGRTTGVVPAGNSWELRQDIPDSFYFEMGGIKYLITPNDLDFETTIIGDGYGGYSYYVSELQNDSQVQQFAIQNATTTPTLRAVITKDNGTYSDLYVDEDNDGEFDLSINPVTGSIVIESDEVSVGDQEVIIKRTGGGYRKLATAVEQGEVAGVSVSVSVDSDHAYLQELKPLLLELEGLLQQLAVAKGITL